MQSSWSCDHRLIHEGHGCQNCHSSQLSQQKQKHYIVKCLSGDCVVLVTITVTTDGCQICHSSVHEKHKHYIVTCLSGVCEVLDECQMGVGFVTAQSTRHMHHIITCQMGSSCCWPGSMFVWQSPTTTYRCTLRGQHPGFQIGFRVVSDLSQLSPQRHKHYVATCLSGDCEVLV